MGDVISVCMLQKRARSLKKKRTASFLLNKCNLANVVIYERENTCGAPPCSLCSKAECF